MTYRDVVRASGVTTSDPQSARAIPRRADERVARPHERVQPLDAPLPSSIASSGLLVPLRMRISEGRAVVKHLGRSRQRR